jgi:carboxypeptidase PM20D1
MDIQNIDRDLATSHLRQILQFDTVTGRTEAFDRLHEYLLQTYPSIFKNVQRFGQHALLFKWQGSDNSLKPWMCIAHQDVVPVPDEEVEQWSFPPFSGELDQGHLYARGALDMKSTLVALLEAIHRLIEEGYQPKRTLYVYMGDDEEIAGPTAIQAVQWMKEQGIRLSHILDEGGAILEELVSGTKQPVALIGIAQKGVMNLKLTVKGESGHAAQPTKDTPIAILGSAIAKIVQHPMPIHSDSLVFPLLRKLASHMPFLQRLMMSNLWLFKPLISIRLQRIPFMNAMMRTTVAPTLIASGIKKNVIPEIATANLNYRLYPGDTASDVVAYVQSLLNDARIELEVEDVSQGTSFSQIDSEGFRHVCSGIPKESVIIAPVLTIGGTDGRHFRDLADDLYQFLFVRGPMDEFKRYHGVDERISVENYLNQIGFYYELIKQ